LVAQLSFPQSYDVIVVGAGHAGCEAALAAARSGCRTLILTPNLDRVGFMPCNPSIGGPGKSHLVAEVDALGGEMARAADRAFLQIRCLNTSKGPAVQALRAQEDKSLYALAMKEALEQASDLELCQDDAISLIFDYSIGDRAKVVGIETRLRGAISANTVIVTAGTFLRAAMIAGESRSSGGRAGDNADADLAQSLTGSGFKLRRLKTGTPPRIDARTVDFSKCEVQPGSEKPLWFSRDGARGRLQSLMLPPASVHQIYATDTWRPQLACFRISTNSQTHELIRENLHRAPMFNGSIQGIGPRYCPSIEDKVARFAEKSSHPIFLEPEGWRTTELYVQGMSTSLPPDVQYAALRSIPALRDVVISRFGYAVEYDAIDPSELTPTLETRRVAGLFVAGQINGTSGYEEAAGQGILAGINAAATVRDLEPLVLRRDQAYIGVMIDDLVNKPFDEPYRMLTSRAEFRLSLRPSTADRRLVNIAYERRLISVDRAHEVEVEMRAVDKLTHALAQTKMITVDHSRGAAEASRTEIPTRPITGAELLRRPGVSIEDVIAEPVLREQVNGYEHSTQLLNLAEEDVKYGAFVEREKREVERRAALEHKLLPVDIDYELVDGLRIEAASKLSARRPGTIGEAGRLLGVTPSDVAALLIHTAKAEAAAF
jgi:tRNA uridine 5-carboxymethylaminomethyl modification enzyme